MILFKCPCCSSVSAVKDDGKDVIVVRCPVCNRCNILSNKTENSYVSNSHLELFKKVEHIVNSMDSLDDITLNQLIDVLCSDYKVDNVVVCEIINALLNVTATGIQDRCAKRSALFFVNLERDSISIKSVIDKLDRKISSENEISKCPENNIGLSIANERIADLQDKNGRLQKQIAELNGKIVQLKNEIARLK